ncbi:hypothetical protein KNE206_72480 [Kitasatospora sp. NE20-6]|uniref:Zn-ribbon domain-containing OB-fold protein n=1 Tax=Kitasatospora sp. NE20-6 TaxID=2859066 RepID=UPI0034DC3385
MNPVATAVPHGSVATADGASVGTPADGDSGPALHFLRCQWCRSAAAPVRMLCPACGSTDLVEERSAGAGTVRRLLPLSRRGSGEPMPYVVALDEGFTVQAAVTGALPGAVPAGTRVELTVATEGLVAFRTAAGQPGSFDSGFSYRFHGGARWYAHEPGARRAG